MKTEKGNDITAFAELALATAGVSMIAPDMVPDWLKVGDFSALATHARPDALYLHAKYYQCLGQYEVMLAIAQTALALSNTEPGVALPEIYLRLMCAIAYYSLERTDEAKRCLLDAMNISLHHGFITPFARMPKQRQTK